MSTVSQKITWLIDPVHTRIRFEAKYLGLSSVSGMFNQFEGAVVTAEENFNNSQIQLTVYTQSITTGLAVRDNHLRSADFFDVKKYPTLTFTSSSIEVMNSTVKVNGELRIKDIVRPLSFEADYIGSVDDDLGNRKAGFEMNMKINRRDFDMTWNQVLDNSSLLLSDEIAISCEIQLLRLP